MFLLGLWDDLRPLGAKTKLIGQLTVATVRGYAGHIHHHLLDKGHSTRRTVLYLYLLCLTFSLAALAVLWTHGHALPIVAAALPPYLSAVSLLGRYLGIGKELSNVRKQVAQGFEWRGTVRRSPIGRESTC